jgi:hypothetical protein
MAAGHSRQSSARKCDSGMSRAASLLMSPRKTFCKGMCTVTDGGQRRGFVAWVRFTPRQEPEASERADGSGGVDTSV